MGAFLHDLRFALRVLVKKPAFTAIVVGTLALGIGAGAAMFSVIHSLVVRPLDLPELDRLVMLHEASPHRGDWNDELAPGGFADTRAQARGFEELCALGWWDAALTGADADPEHLYAYQVSPGFFSMLGVRPLLGRWFTADEDSAGARVVVVGHRLWQRRFGGDPQLVGRAVTVDGVSHTVVGIMPAGFNFPAAAELWGPLVLSPEQKADHGSRWLRIIGKLRPGVSLETADAEVRVVAERIAAQNPITNRGRAMRAVPLARGITEDFTRAFLFILFGAALFVLAIACANVANVFLAHAVARRRELAVRAALGAGRGRIVRQLLTEAALLGLLGAAASLLVASWAIDVIKGALSPEITRFISGWETMGVDGTVLGVAIAAGVAVGLLFGVAPAMQVSRTDVNTVLKEGDARGGSSTRGRRLRSALVVSQVALALVLLFGTGGLVRAFIRLADPGGAIDPENVLTLRASLPETRYPDQPTVRAFQERVTERLRALPGAVAVGATNNVPWGSNGWGRGVYPEGRELPTGEAINVDFRTVTPGYHELLRVPLLEGRSFATGDGAAAPRVAVVSANAARVLWPGESPIGKRVRWTPREQAEWWTVVGVVADFERRPGERRPRPTLYVPFAQSPYSPVYFAVRTAGDPLALARAATAAVTAVDPLQPVSHVRTLVGARDERLSGIRVGAGMMGAFAILALVLAVVGLYGVIANLVEQRTREIGVRMALGARRGDVVRLVVGKGLLLTVVGAAVGLAAGVATVRFLASVLVGTIDGGLALFAGVTLLVVTMALLGSLIPALRATRVDPMVALRHD